MHFRKKSVSKNSINDSGLQLTSIDSIVQKVDESISIDKPECSNSRQESETKESTQNQDDSTANSIPEPTPTQTFFNDFNIDDYIASNAQMGNLDVIEVDTIENFKMS